MQDRKTRCRYLKRDGNQCTAEAVDDTADVLLCAKHVALVMELLKDRLGAAA